MGGVEDLHASIAQLACAYRRPSGLGIDKLGVLKHSTGTLNETEGVLTGREGEV